MRAATAAALGLRRARRHPGAALGLYLASLAPTLLLVTLLAQDLAILDHSPFASRVLSGDAFAVLADFQSSPEHDLAPVWGALPAWLLLSALIQIAVAAGVVEVLLERGRRGEHPFAGGIGRHGWAFLRSAVGFALLAGICLVVAVIAGHLGSEAAREQGDGRLLLAARGAAALLFLVLFAPLDLAYDLSRIAAASHGERRGERGDRRTFLGLLKALGFVWRYPLLFAPLWLVFALLIAAPWMGHVALRPLWRVDTGAEVALLALGQQAVFLLAAFFKSALWGAEIALYQGFGEPRWCRGRQPGKQTQPGAAPHPPPTIDGWDGRLR